MRVVGESFLKIYTCICVSVLCSMKPVGFNLKDLLHTLHQGVSLCAIAALVTDHYNCKHPGQTLQDLERCLLQAYKHYRAWCKTKKISGSSLRFNLNRFGRDGWKSMPELSTQYKASTVKYMQYWLHDFLMDEPEVPHSADRRHCSYSLAMFQYMLDTHSEWFTQCQADRTAQFGYSFLLFYQKLAVRSRSEPRNNYKIVPKFHYFFHMQEYIEETLRNVRHWVSENVFLTLRVLKGVKFPDVPIFILNSFDFFYPQVQV